MIPQVGQCSVQREAEGRGSQGGRNAKLPKPILCLDLIVLAISSENASPVPGGYHFAQFSLAPRFFLSRSTLTSYPIDSAKSYIMVSPHTKPEGEQKYRA